MRCSERQRVNRSLIQRLTFGRARQGAMESNTITFEDCNTKIPRYTLWGHRPGFGMAGVCAGGFSPNEPRCIGAVAREAKLLLRNEHFSPFGIIFLLDNTLKRYFQIPTASNSLVTLRNTFPKCFKNHKNIPKIIHFVSVYFYNSIVLISKPTSSIMEHTLMGRV